MNCPSCHSGTIRRFPVSASKGAIVVCDNANCNHFFVAINGDLAKDERTTVAVKMSVTDKTEFQAMVSQLGEYP